MLRYKQYCSRLVSVWKPKGEKKSKPPSMESEGILELIVPALTRVERRHGNERKPRGQSLAIAPPSALTQQRHGRHTRLVLQTKKED